MFSISETIGGRFYMEDFHTCYPQNNYYAVFDGHGGDQVAKWCSKYLYEKLDLDAVADDDLDSHCKTVFEKVDDFMRSKLKERFMSGEIETEAGSTANIIYMRNNTIFCINLGDSRSVLASSGKVEALSKDHKPYDEIEKARIEANGGFVKCNRVLGDLAVSRALGDFDFKRKGWETISNEPEITKRVIDYENDHFIICATDGLWDGMSNEEVADHVYQRIRDGKSFLEVATFLTRKARARSADNCTVIVIPLLKSEENLDQWRSRVKDFCFQ